MAVPDFPSFFLPTLRAFMDGGEHTVREVRQIVAEALQLTDADKVSMYSDGRTPVYAGRANWAVTYLHRAGALEKVRRGVYRITERGRKILENDPAGLTVQDLLQFEEFRGFFMPRGRGVPEEQTRAAPQEALPPLERLEQAYSQAREELVAELLERLKRVDPAFFERLVLDLLVAMGYGGSIEDAAAAVGRPGDEGVDGIIKEDKLGLDVVYVQAKRWENTVGRPQVQTFAGALEGRRARKGVFITTSAFTSDAQEYVRQIEKKIVLIDGRQLAELMIDHDVGVTVTRTYKLKRVDSDYFEEED